MQLISVEVGRGISAPAATANILGMNLNTTTPAVLSPSIVSEGAAMLPGDWLSPALADQSHHWRLANLPALEAADAALKALFVIAYHRVEEEDRESRKDFRVELIDVGATVSSPRTSPEQRLDERFGKGFSDEVRRHSAVLVDRCPGPNPLGLLMELSAFLRFEASGPAHAKGPAARALETVWEQMDVGWVN